MTTLQAITLGIIQGLTEFLPISSTAHLILLPKFFNWPQQGLAFDAILHLGTAAAAIFYFRRTWQRLVSSFRLLVISKIRGLKLEAIECQNARLLTLIIIATTPAALTGFLLEDTIKANFRTPTVIATMLTLVAILMLIAEKSSKNLPVTSLRPELRPRGYQSPVTSFLLIGLSQVLALIPGTSRSAITIVAGMLLGLSRAEAAKTSFLLATPIILGAGGFELLKTAATLPHIFDLNLLVAFLTTTVAAFLTIKFFLKFLKILTLIPFTLYRLLLAFAIFTFF